MESTELLNSDFGRHVRHPPAPMAGWCRFKPIATRAASQRRLQASTTDGAQARDGAPVVNARKRLGPTLGDWVVRKHARKQPAEPGAFSQQRRSTGPNFVPLPSPLENRNPQPRHSKECPAGLFRRQRGLALLARSRGLINSSSSPTAHAVVDFGLGVGGVRKPRWLLLEIIATRGTKEPVRRHKSPTGGLAGVCSISITASLPM